MTAVTSLFPRPLFYVPRHLCVVGVQMPSLTPTTIPLATAITASATLTVTLPSYSPRTALERAYAPATIKPVTSDYKGTLHDVMFQMMV